MSRQSILLAARAEENTKESPAGSNKQKYGQWYGMNGVKWCAIFVSFIYDKAGHRLEVETPKGFHYCHGGFSFWKSRGELTKTPQAGDIVLYDWQGDGHCDHTGIFDSWKDKATGKFCAWEGNTEVGADSDGGKVMLRERSVSLVKAFVSPKVLNDASGNPPSNYLNKGDRGSDVSYLQKLLWDMKYDIVIDGIYGTGTETIVRKFQKDYFLSETGVVGPEVLGAMEEQLHNQMQAVKKTSTASYLQKGNSGSAVMALQQALNNAGVKPLLIVDGMFGNATNANLKKYQRSKKLTADGIAGPKTFEALNVFV